MTTRSADERLSAYLDGELTDDEVADLEAELQRDPELHAELASLRAVVQLLGDDGPARAPLGFHAAVMERVQAEGNVVQLAWWRRPLGVPLQGWAVAAAAAAVLLMVVRPPATPEGAPPRWREVEQVPTEGESQPAAVKLPPAREKGTDAAGAEAGSGKAEKVAASPREPEGQEDAAQAVPPDVAPAEAAPAPVLRTLPAGYTLLTDDPASLRAVLALVGKLGGTVTTPEGAPVTMGALERSEQAVIVKIPAGALADFQSGLSRLGKATADFDKDALYARTELDLHLTFKLVGGGPGTSDEGAPMAPARKMLEADMAAPEGE